MRKNLLLLFLLGLVWGLSAQPVNDNCSNATVINIPNNGFGFGTFITDTISLSGATTELGETFAAGVPNSKSVWYRFSIPTTREVRILLDQTTNMPTNSAGWRLYKNASCLPAQAVGLDPPIFNIEGFTHACLRAGDYLVQIGAENSANGDIFLGLIVGPPSAPEIKYDFAAHAYDFQVLSGVSNRNTNYEVGCQSYFEGEKLCPDSSYTKTTWHVFTTDNHVDAVRLEVRENPFNTSVLGNRNFAVALYEGDIRLDSTGLPILDSCSQLLQVSQNNYDAVFYPCLLDPNTTYSIQLLFPTEYFGAIDVNLNEIGGSATAGPDPATLPATHTLGTLSLGNTYQVTDYFACNARTSLYSCGNIIEDSIYFAANSTPYDMNWWVTFDLSAQTDVNISLDNYLSQPTPKFRLFRGSAADSCNLQLISENYTSQLIPCLDAGTYSLQILGQIKAPAYPAYTSNLGKSVRANIELTSQTFNQFGLQTATAYDSINGLNALLPGNIYYSADNTADCNPTVMPAGDSCFINGKTHDRAMYRIIEIGQDGILTVGGGDWGRRRYKLFAGDASTAPVSNGTLQGLQDLSCCQSTYYSFKNCVSAGKYTLVTYADSTDIGDIDRPWVRLDTFPPASFTTPATAEVMDTLSLASTSINATPTYFTCGLNNPLTILGNAPCSNATKQVYREFYLADSASLDFDNLQIRHHWGGGVTYRIFTGRISTNSLTALTRDCFTSFDMSSCDFMPQGWYTVVSYHDGETTANPAYCSGTGDGIGDLNNFAISINPPYPDPIYNTFAKAEQVNSGNPISWVNRIGHTDTIPFHDTTIILGTDYFNCENDMPFPAGVTACNAGENRTSYRVFTLNRASHVYLYTGNYLYAKLYRGDIRGQIAPFTLEHDCFYRYARLCLQPGTYTLVIFGDDANAGMAFTPTIYLDSLGTSKYDHARHAYNFGNVIRDSAEYRAAVGDPTDVWGRPASNDFLLCTTSAQASDPYFNGCIGGSETLPYATSHPLSPRTNLWYTFELTGPGNAAVSVYGLTPSKSSNLPFTVYRVNNNVVPLTDSTLTDLTLVSTNILSYCYLSQSINIFRDPCSGITTDRYVIIVDQSRNQQPNTQIQVGIRFSDIPGTAVQYDHYSTANVISGNPTTTCNAPYSALPLFNGTYTGCEGNLTCATLDPTDQNNCGTQTIWYKFEVSGSGRMRVNYTRTDQMAFNAAYTSSEMMLFRQVVPGDSTTSGLQNLTLARVYENNPSLNASSYYWGQTCFTSGTYYLMFTGCNTANATIYPRVWLENFPGDYCTDSLQITVDTVGTFQSMGTVDCWTIGEAPGENSVSSMGCLGDPQGKKSGWFHITIADTGKMDLDISLTENTSANALQVLYRVSNGRCTSMTFENCVDDGAFITLNLKCRQDSGLWIQVVVPEQATGDVTIHVSATRSTDQSCDPLNPFAPSASFDFLPACEGDVIQFSNQSTIGTGLSYLWDFGDGFTSTFREPSHTYFTADTFLVSLIVGDTAFADTSERVIIIFPIPQVSFSALDTVTAGNPMLFTNQSTNTLNSATYYWDFCAGGGFCSVDTRTFAGSNPPPITYNVPGTYLVCLTVVNGVCERTYCDSVVVEFLNFFSGGPYDGFDFNDSSYCSEINFFTGGPYDGFDYDDSSYCQPINFFAGGPYDGFDYDDSSFCQPINFFTGGPYDGFDYQDDPNICRDTMVSIFSGGPYDGADDDDILLNCQEPTIWAGGPFDGAADALREVDCQTPNFFTGGPFDGTQKIDSSYCDEINFFAGGPYDGFDYSDSSYCQELNFFSGGPYDGFDYDDSSFCQTINFFTGGPYDGFDTDNSGRIRVDGVTVCVGDTARLIASAATDWYDQPTGGTLLATSTDTYIIPSLGQSTVVYADNVCDNTGRVAAVAHVIDTLAPSFTSAVNCAQQTSFFASQTLVAGASTPTIGTEITALGQTGFTPGIREMSFSTASYSNFARLTDGNLLQDAWRSGNTTASTEWIQWNYFTPRSVDRITFSNFYSAAALQPQEARLYYAAGGPWILVKVWDNAALNTTNFDSGPLCETTNKYANRWKLELDGISANVPHITEFQVYANLATSSGNVDWDFGDGSTATGSSITHVYATQGIYTVSLTANGNCACATTITQQVTVDSCIVLPLLTHYLYGEYTSDETIDLSWQVAGEFESAYLEKYLNGHWLELRHFDSRGQSAYTHADDQILYELSNLYRIRVSDGERFRYSNIVEILPPTPTLTLKLFPNPATESVVYLRLRSAEAGFARAELLNMLGQVLEERERVQVKGEHTFEFSSAGLPEGQYFVRVWIDGVPEVRKLVVFKMQ